MARSTCCEHAGGRLRRERAHPLWARLAEQLRRSPVRVSSEHERVGEFCPQAQRVDMGRPKGLLRRDSAHDAPEALRCHRMVATRLKWVNAGARGREREAGD